MMSMRTTLGRPTTLGRSDNTSEDVLVRSETLLLEETLLFGFSVEGYDYQSNQRGLDLDHLASQKCLVIVGFWESDSLCKGLSCEKDYLFFWF